MNSKRIALGIGIVLLVMAVFAAPAAADSTARFDPQHGSGNTSEWVKVVYYVDIEAGENLAVSQQTIKFDPEIISVGLVCVEHDCGTTIPTGAGQYCWGAFDHNDTYLPNGYSWSFNGDPRISEWQGPPYNKWVWKSLIGEGFDHTNTDGTIEIATYWVQPLTGDMPGVSPFNFDFERFPSGCPICQECAIGNWTPAILPVIWENGTFTHDYVISGYANTSEGDPATRVNITNLNKSIVEDISAYVDPGTGYYSLALDMPSEVEADNVLRITACKDIDNNESKCNVSYHTVVNAPGQDANINLTLNHYCLNYLTFPYRTWNDPNWSGPATMQMLVDHYRPLEPTQTYLNTTGIAHNQQPCNADLQYVDPAGMKWTLNDILHNTSSYGGGNYANYGIGNHSTIEDVLHYICKYQYLGPGAAPAYGDYANWMVVRGIHTNKTPSYTQGSYDIYGFWINDPKDPGGIGENTYKSVDQWTSTYHLNLTDVETCDKYYGRYVAVCEPPEDDDVEVTLAKPKPRLTEAITPVLAEKPLRIYGVEQLALEKVVKDDEMLRIVAAAIDGANEELVPYDAEFADVFAKTVPGSPMFVASEAGDYYVVPFNVPVELKLIKKVPVAIEKIKMSGLKKLERMKCVDERIVVKPIPIEPAKIERTLVVVVVDADDGSFKEASWVADPVKYLPVSKVEALKLALGEVAITDSNELRALGSKPTIELVYRDASPYYPDWKITVNDKVFYVSQDGTVSS